MVCNIDIDVVLDTVSLELLESLPECKQMYDGTQSCCDDLPQCVPGVVAVPPLQPIEVTCTYQISLKIIQGLVSL